MQVETRGDLRSKLANRPSGGIVFATIQKFMPGADEDTFPVLSERANIVVIADEARTARTLARTTGPKPSAMRPWKTSLPVVTMPTRVAWKGFTCRSGSGARGLGAPELLLLDIQGHHLGPGHGLALAHLLAAVQGGEDHVLNGIEALEGLRVHAQEPASRSARIPTNSRQIDQYQNSSRTGHKQLGLSHSCFSKPEFRVKACSVILDLSLQYCE